MSIKSIQVLALSAALMIPAAGAFAQHSRTRGTIVGAVAGGLIGGTKGAVVGGALGNGIQYERNHQAAKSRRHHHRR
ncbi:MAG TPA: hypothetical protein VF381_05400, partial [Thermoanaerobaculia bacterium]